MFMPLKSFLVVFSVLLFSCQASTGRIDRKTLDLFRDFRFVGQGPATFETDGSLDVTYVIPHSEREQSRPDKLQTNTQYVFHNLSPTDNKLLGSRELPDRLRELGFQVVEAPNLNGGNFSYPYFGGPYFSITFMDGDHKGVIFNRVDTRNGGDQTWVVHDYVLVFLS
jgi:hypothetical protein